MHDLHDHDPSRGGMTSSQGGMSSRRGVHRLLHGLWFPVVHRALAKQLMLHPGETVVDVGCGTGELARRLAASGAQVIGVDPDERSIAIARAGSSASRIAFHLASAESLPLPDGTADAVVSSVSAHHWTDRERGFAEIARVLRPRGRVVLAEMTPPGGLRRALRGHRAHREAPGAGEWLKLLEGAGLTNARVAGVGWRRALALFVRAEAPTTSRELGTGVAPASSS